MTSVITGDIINSSKYENPEVWLVPLKEALAKTGIEKKYWEIYRGDSFQLEIRDLKQTVETVLYLKACIKSIKNLDVRMAIGVGRKSFEGKTVTESNGEAFLYSGETLETMKKEKVSLKIKTSNPQLNNELNLYFKLASVAIDNWSVNSAEIVKLSIEHPDKIQSALAKIIGTSQDAVSKRMKRAHLDELQELVLMYKEKIATL